MLVVSVPLNGSHTDLSGGRDGVLTGSLLRICQVVETAFSTAQSPRTALLHIK